MASEFLKQFKNISFNKHDIKHRVSLRYMACYFDTFIHFNVIADVVVFITVLKSRLNSHCQTTLRKQRKKQMEFQDTFKGFSNPAF